MTFYIEMGSFLQKTWWYNIWNQNAMLLRIWQLDNMSLSCATKHVGFKVENDTYFVLTTIIELCEVEIGPKGRFTRGPKSQVQRGGKVSTCEPRVITRIWFTIIKVGSWSCHAQIFAGLMLRAGSSFLLNPTRNTSWQASPPKSVAMQASMSWSGLRAWDPMWRPKSRLPCSQWLRLHGLTQRTKDLGLRVK